MRPAAHLLILPLLLLSGCPQGCKPAKRFDRFDPRSTERFLDHLGKHRVATQTLDNDAGEPEGPIARDETAVVAITRDPNTLSPILDPDVIARQVVFGTIYEPLVRWLPDADGVLGPQPGALSGWTIDVTGKRLELTVREGARWHDGRQVSSSDVQFTLDTLRSQSARGPYYQHLLAFIERVELVSPKKVRLQLTRPTTYALRALAEIPVLPFHALTAPEVFQQSGYKKPLGSGPWRFVRWKKGSEILLARADSYDGPRPGFPFLSFIVEPDGAQVITRAKQGDIDIITDLPPSYIPEQIESPAIASAFDRVTVTPARFFYLVLNVRKGQVLEDVRLRRALGALVDRKNLVEMGFHNQARELSTPVWEQGPVVGPAAALPKNDLEYAKHQLEYSDWWDTNRDGFREKQGVRLTLRMLATDGPITKALTDKLVPAARDAGIVFTALRADPAFIAAKLRQGDFDLALVEYAGVPDEDLGPLLEDGAPRNYGGVTDAEIASALEALRRAEPGARKNAAERLSRDLLERVPIITLARPQTLILVSKRIDRVDVIGGTLDLSQVSPR